MSAHLPREILDEIFRHLCVREAIPLRRVCRRWNVILQDSLKKSVNFLWSSNCTSNDSLPILDPDEKENFKVVGVFRESYAKGDEIICVHTKTREQYLVHLRSGTSRKIGVLPPQCNLRSKIRYHQPSRYQVQIELSAAPYQMSWDCQKCAIVNPIENDHGPWFPAEHVKIEPTLVENEFTVFNLQANTKHTLVASAPLSSPIHFVVYGSRIGVLCTITLGCAVFEVYDLSQIHRDGRTLARCFWSYEFLSYVWGTSYAALSTETLYCFKTNKEVAIPDLGVAVFKIYHRHGLYTIWEDFLLQEEISDIGERRIRIYDLLAPERAALVKEFLLETNFKKPSSPPCVAFDGKFLSFVTAGSRLSKLRVFSFSIE